MQEQIIAIESQRWKWAGVKDQHIRETLGISATRYYQLLNALLDDPEAEARWPMEVRRIRRLREVRRGVRSAFSEQQG